MNVTAAAKRLMDSMTPQQIESALRSAQASQSNPKIDQKMTRGKGKKKIVDEAATGVNKNTRPLNSYMAFRSFYSTIFSSVQQKDISGFVTYMWQADPFKAKWTVLAKAYSAIRDVQGKANAPLVQFLAMNTPLVGIIEPEHYLEAMGWKFNVEADGHIEITREEPTFDVNALSPSVSVNGVIQNCYLQGYFTGDLSDVLLSNDEATVTVVNPNKPSLENMDAVAGPSSQGCCEDLGEQSGSTDDMPGDQKMLTEEVSADEVDHEEAGQSRLSASNYQSEADQDHGVQQQMSMDLDASALNSSSYAVPEAAKVTSVAAPSENVQKGMSNVLQPAVSRPPVEALFPAEFRLPQGEFALEEAFDPLLYDEQPVFDPFAGNQFDAFDWMDGWDEYINFDACT